MPRQKNPTSAPHIRPPAPRKYPESFVADGPAPPRLGLPEITCARPLCNCNAVPPNRWTALRVVPCPAHNAGGVSPFSPRPRPACQYAAWLGSPDTHPFGNPSRAPSPKYPCLGHESVPCTSFRHHPILVFRLPVSPPRKAQWALVSRGAPGPGRLV